MASEDNTGAHIEEEEPLFADFYVVPEPEYALFRPDLREFSEFAPASNDTEASKALWARILSASANNAVGRAVTESHRMLENANGYYRSFFLDLQKQMTSMQKEFRDRLDSLTEEKDNLQHQLEDLEASMLDAAKQTKLLKRQLDKLPADLAGSSSGTKSKMPDPPTFSGSDNKGDLEDWFHQVKLYTKHMGIVTDTQQIVYALSRVRSPATKYLTSYFVKNTKDQDLGTWEDFAKTLRGIYGQKDALTGAKEELAALWNNKSLAHRDFIKYSEQFKTLASIVDYKDDVLIDKLKDVLSDEMKTSVGLIEVIAAMPTKWGDYLDKLLEIYKKTTKQKVGTRIFGKDKETPLNDKPAPFHGKAKEANTTDATKATRFCQICSGKGKKGAAKTHNTNDCYDKPGNESKRPQPKASSSGTSSASRPAGASGSQGKGSGSSQRNYKSFKARLMEALEAMSDDEDDNTSAPVISNNTARIEEIEEEEEVEALLRSVRSSSKDTESAKSGSARSTSSRTPVFHKGM